MAAYYPHKKSKGKKSYSKITDYNNFPNQGLELEETSFSQVETGQEGKVFRGLLFGIPTAIIMWASLILAALKIFS